MRKHISLLGLFYFFAVSILFFQCNEDDPNPVVYKRPEAFGNELVRKYYNLTFELVKQTAGYTPPVAARTYGYLSVCLYESLVQGSLTHRSVQGLVDGIPSNQFPKAELTQEYQWELVASAAMSEFLRNQFKTNTSGLLSSVDSLENSIANSATNPESIKSRSISFGKSMGKAVYDYAATDGQSEAQLNNFPDYNLPSFPGSWVPTAPNQKPLQPYWGQVRPFVSASIASSQPSSHPVFSTDSKSLFYIAAQEVYSNVINLSAENKIIAEYWSDDPVKTATPGGHSLSIALQVCELEQLNLMNTAEIILKVGMSVHDAFISCWKCKYQFNLLRPVSYIKQYIDPNFNTLLSTPPFPEYTSGHSVQTAASMSVLAIAFGTNYSLTDRTHENRVDINGSARSFSSFTDLENEVAISRLYGGIHYRFGIEAGVLQGRKIGRIIAEVNLKK